MAFILQVFKKSTDPISGEIEHEASEQLNGMALKGSVDHTGQIVIPFQFESIGEFEHTYTVATKKDKKGKAYSVIIDLDGNEIVKTPYELIYLLNSDSTLIAFKENEKWGIMELNGKVLVQPHYQEVDKIPELDMFKLEDVDSTFLAPCSNPKELKAIGPAGNFEIHQVGTSCLPVLLSTERKISSTTLRLVVPEYPCKHLKDLAFQQDIWVEDYPADI